MKTKSTHKEKAQGMVEFALVLPLLLLVMFAVIEFGRLLFIYSAVFTASREAARYGAAAGDVGNYVPHYQDCAGITATARRITNLVGINTITISYDDGNGNSLGTCPDGAINVGLGDRVIVSVAATYQPILPLVQIPLIPISSQTARTVLRDIPVSGTPSAPNGTVSVFFESDHSDVGEGDGEVTVRVRLSALFREDVWVPFSVTGGTATQGADYTVDTTSPLLIRSGATTAEIHIRINQDSLDEEDQETAILSLGTPTNASLGSPSTHTLRINDDDAPPSVSFTLSEQSITEPNTGSSTTAQVTLRLSVISGRNVSVPFNIDADGSTASQGADYLIDTGSPVLIPAGQISSQINVRVIGETLDEEDETVRLVMGTPVNATRGLITEHTVTILDDDLPPFVSFTWDHQEVTEDAGLVGIQVQLSAASGKTVTVPYSLSGTATEGDDYSIAPSPLVIPPGSTLVDIPVTINLDTLDETDETVIVSMGSPVNASLGQPSVHTLVIQPYVSPPRVFFVPIFQQTPKSSNSVDVSVQLSHAYYLDVTVPILIEGTARQGLDYQITPTTPVVVPAGSASTPIHITIISDLIDEPDEEIKLTMGTPTNATLGNPYVHETLIQDDDNTPTVYFTTSSQSGNEAAGSMPVTVRLSNISGRDVMVPFTVSGSATQGSDYDISPTSLVTIPAGYQERTINITVINDDQPNGTNVGEPDETIILTMGTPVNAVAGTTYNVHTATITAWVCPTASNPYFESPSSVGLIWPFSNAGISPIRLMQVQIIWPTQGNTRMNGISFGTTIWSGNSNSGNLTVNTPVPLWGGAFTSQQMIFLFNSSTYRRPISVTARFEHCLPLTRSLSQ